MYYPGVIECEKNICALYVLSHNKMAGRSTLIQMFKEYHTTQIKRK